MILGVYSIYDEKADYFNNPIFCPTEAVVLRDFGDTVNDSGCIVGKHPEDFRLYNLGTFDTQTAKFDIRDIPLLVSAGLDLVRLGCPSEVSE